MTIEEGSYSLKLECALRDLGFVEIGYRVIAHAGLFFVSPVSASGFYTYQDDLLGFQLLETPTKKTTYGHSHIVTSAKRALDLALQSSQI